MNRPLLTGRNWPEGLRLLVMKLQHETPPEIAHLREKLVVSFHFLIFSYSVEQVAYLKIAFWASNPMWCQQTGIVRQDVIIIH